MGTIKSSESLAEADYLRSARTLSQEQVDEAARSHEALVRYNTHDRAVAAAH